MNKVWTVWTANDDMETLLVGIATTEEKAYKMKGKLEEQFEDAFEYQICCMETDKLIIDNKDVKFQHLNFKKIKNKRLISYYILGGFIMKKNKAYCNKYQKYRKEKGS